MTKEELKQRLIELLDDLNFEYGEILADCYENNSKYDVPFGEFFAEKLIANGVTIRERGEWQEVYQNKQATVYECSKCHHLSFGTSDYCICGADMRGDSK